MSERKFFCIRGYMKSGTNWVCRLLNLHPEVHSSGEFHWSKYFQTYQRNNQVFKNLADIESDGGPIRRELELMVRRVMEKLAPAEAKFIGDRTPHMIHPVVIRNAPHISVVRDCRDIIVSRMFHYFNLPGISSYFDRKPHREMIRKEFVHDPWLFQKNPELLLEDEQFVRQTAAQWKEYLSCDRNTMRVHEKLAVKLVKYEDLHANLDQEVESLVTFIGADPAKMPKIPNHLCPGHKEEKPNRFNRKGIVGDWKNYMTASAAQWINEEVGDELLHQNYVQSLDWFLAEKRAVNQAKANAAVVQRQANAPQPKPNPAAGQAIPPQSPQPQDENANAPQVNDSAAAIQPAPRQPNGLKKSA